MSNVRPMTLARLMSAACVAALVTGALAGCSVPTPLRALIEDLRNASSGSNGSDQDDIVTSDDGNTYIDDIGIGDCLNDAALVTDEEIEVASIDVVDCDEPHDSEVYGFVPYEIEDYPEEDELFLIADDGCYNLFDDWTGGSYEDLPLEFSYYTPTPRSWRWGDREAMCVIFDIDEEKLTGSTKNVGLQGS